MQWFVNCIVIFEAKFARWRLSNPTGQLPVIHHKASHLTSREVQAQSDKNPCDMHMHVPNSPSNIAIHMPCVDMHCAGHYQLEMVFTCVHLPPIAMDSTLHSI